VLFWSDYTQIINTIIWYDSGMSRIPPIPPQSGIAVGFDFVGKFVNEWKTIGVGAVLSRD
jgi:hypothetical protein